MILRCVFCSRIDFCVGVKAHHKSSRKLTCYDLTCVCEQMFWTFIFTIHAESECKDKFRRHRNIHDAVSMVLFSLNSITNRQWSGQSRLESFDIPTMVNGRRDGPSAVDLTIDVENYNRVFNMLNL